MTTTAVFRRDVDTAIEDAVSPPREGRSTDVSRLSFPIQMVIAIVASALTVGGGIWATNAGLRSDVRDILTRMESEQRIRAIETRAQEDRANSMNDSINEMKRRMELIQLQYNQLREDMLTKGRR